MHDQHLIGKMRDLKATMLFVAEKLDGRGLVQRAVARD